AKEKWLMPRFRRSDRHNARRTRATPLRLEALEERRLLDGTPPDFSILAASGTVRFASFNASLNRNVAGQLIDDLSHPNDPLDDAQALRVQQAKNVAEILQRTRPDVVLINEFDFDTAGPDGRPLAPDLFRDNFLEVSQNGAAPIEYPYVYDAPSNTGVASGFD